MIFHMGKELGLMTPGVDRHLSSLAQEETCSGALSLVSLAL